ncbi:MAG: STAS domain-containing protein [Cyanobacteria bacterium J069]|nr:MAG: anti-sigma factor antagonist [Cyanobacteria bacterium J069]
MIKVIQLSGILDGTQVDAFHQLIGEALATSASTILVDLKEITFMDSSGLGALASAHKKVRASGKRLSFCSIHEQVRILFELTSMDQVFEVFADRQAFDQTVLSGAAS